MQLETLTFIDFLYVFAFFILDLVLMFLKALYSFLGAYMSLFSPWNNNITTIQDFTLERDIIKA